MKEALLKKMVLKYPPVMVIGLGKTGLSCARHLAAQGVDFMLLDTREKPPCRLQLQRELPHIQLLTGPLDRTVLAQAECLIVSPGIAVDHPAIRAAIQAGVKISSDIDLFCEAVTAPIVAITGSNAKSTVTTMVGLMAAKAGKQVQVGGNLGTPVLDLMLAAQGEPEATELYVLELSSFQLETTSKLRAGVATILNISPDHMDRYDSYADYRHAKQRIFRGCRKVVENRDQPSLHGLLSADVELVGFSLHTPQANEFGVIHDSRGSYLACGKELLLQTTELLTKGKHSVSNALAALALGSAAGLPMAAMLEVLRQFEGLPHRCQRVRRWHEVDYYNDSKATNVGAAVAAIDGLGGTIAGRIVLIAGGEAKGEDFSGLMASVSSYCKALILIGSDAAAVNTAVKNAGLKLPIVMAASMQQAVAEASVLANKDDLVLLSPACASFDMFDNFEHRGKAFMAAVRALR